MNAGLSNLDVLKRHLLAGSLAGESRFDGVILAIGLGVAGLFDVFCNRKLAYLAGAEVVFTGDRSHYVLPRYPLVSVASVTTRFSDADAWDAATGEPWSTHPAAGVIRFAGVLGTELLQVRVVWTGGYWFETNEPEDAGFPALGPVGAVYLPDDLRAAFLLQCEAVWGARDRLGTGLLSGEGTASGLGKLELLPMVKEMLRGHVRYQLS